MKIQLTQPVKNYEGKDLLENKEPIKLRTVFVTALNTVPPGENGNPEILSPDQKARIYQLSCKLYEGDSIDLSLDDRGFIKERVGKVYNALVYGQVCGLLEGDAK